MRALFDVDLLLARAVAQNGRFATLDQKIPISAVVGAREIHLVVI